MEGRKTNRMSMCKLSLRKISEEFVVWRPNCSDAEIILFSTASVQRIIIGHSDQCGQIGKLSLILQQIFLQSSPNVLTFLGQFREPSLFIQTTVATF